MALQLPSVDISTVESFFQWEDGICDVAHKHERGVVYSQNACGFNSTCANVVSFTSIRKVRTSLGRFPTRYTDAGIMMCESLFRNRTIHLESTDISSFVASSKYDFHCADLHEKRNKSI